ncbi:MAG: hypothetical protein WC554_18920 [Clostridia bacterium]
MNFTRGLDPKTAMNIGITTWENLQPGHVLCVKKYVKITTERKFARDRAFLLDLSPSLHFNNYVLIKEIKRTLKNRVFILDIVFVVNSQIKTLTLLNPTWQRSLSGPIDQFKKHFDIVQHLKL